MKRYAGFCIAFIFASLIPLYATTVQQLTLDELVAKSDSIVSGQVVASQSYWNSDRKLIFTSHKIEVRESIKGNTPQTVTITTVGGRVGNTVLHVSGMPAFEPGENAILFLEKTKSYTTVVGLSQGKFTISNGKVSNTITGLSFPDGAAGNSLKLPLAEFKRQIQLRLGK